MKHPQLNLLVLPVALAAACQSSPEEGVDLPGSVEEACDLVDCDESPFELDGERMGLLGVTLTHDDAGAVHIEELIEADTLVEVGQPMSRASGTHIVAALDANGDWLDGRAVAFETQILLEGGPEVARTSLEIPIEHQRTTTWFDASLPIDRVVVYDEAGEAVATIDAGDAASRRGTMFRSHPGQHFPSAACGHVYLMDSSDSLGIGPETIAAQQVVGGPFDPSHTQTALVAKALNQMAPTLCHATTRIAFIESENEGLGGFHAAWVGGEIHINVSRGYREEDLVASKEKRLNLVRTIMHEAGHAAEALLRHEGQTLSGLAGPVQGDWVPNGLQSGLEHVERLRLQGGFDQQWFYMHQRFVLAEFGAHPYPSPSPYEEFFECPPDIKTFEPHEVAEAGFMSRYGGTNYSDDIADMAAWAAMGDAYREAGIDTTEAKEIPFACGFDADLSVIEDSACQILREYDGGGIALPDAAVYAKLRLLRDLDMVTDEAFDNCVGDVGFEVPGEGFHVYEEGAYKRSFDGNLDAGIGLHEGTNTWIFQMDAEGSAVFDDVTYDAEVRLGLPIAPGEVDVDLVSWPRGGWQFEYLGDATSAQFSVSLPDAAAGTFQATDGFVLITSATNDLIEGSVVVQEAWRPFAPIPVPEFYDPPLVFRFQISN